MHTCMCCTCTGIDHVQLPELATELKCFFYIRCRFCYVSLLWNFRVSSLWCCTWNTAYTLPCTTLLGLLDSYVVSRHNSPNITPYELTTSPFIGRVKQNYLGYNSAPQKRGVPSCHPISLVLDGVLSYSVSERGSWAKEGLCPWVGRTFLVGLRMRGKKSRMA